MSSEDSTLIEQYFNAEFGYKPILIREGWQVGHLNFTSELAAEAIDRVERHNRTDEVFILFRGTAKLVAADGEHGGLRFEAVRMQPGVTYNIPASCWHTIAMTPEALVIIVERNLTHANDVEYRALTDSERMMLQAVLHRAAGAAAVR